MKITVTINTCSDCRHRDHSGAFTPGGAKPVCSHPNAVECATKNKEKPVDRFHWKHRVIREKNGRLKIPSWCPLKNGSSY